MGWIRHHGIVVTSWDKTAIDKAHEQAKAMFPPDTVTNLARAPLNGYQSFLVAPDGSKENWADSDLGDERREAFVRWLNEHAYEDGSSSLHWIEYEHDTDNGQARVVRAYGVSESESAS
jgi:hypothetical protein